MSAGVIVEKIIVHDPDPLVSCGAWLLLRLIAWSFRDYAHCSVGTGVCRCCNPCYQRSAV
jgi:hypothetical protein